MAKFRYKNRAVNLMEYQEEIAKILRVDKGIIRALEEILDARTGKKDVLKKIIQKNNKLVTERMSRLGLAKDSKASEVYDALISKIEADDLRICEAIGVCSAKGYDAAKNICEFLYKLGRPLNGYFLKLSKAEEFLRAEPPKMVLKALGYETVDEMLKKEDLLEVFSALRFLEDMDWLNNIFFKQYEKLTPDDFELREVVMRPLGAKWAAAAEKFVAKKYHNVSHLKELGVIFVIPVFLGISGETLRLIALLLHYKYEVRFYASLFEGYIKDRNSDFAAKIISLLRGDVVTEQTRFVNVSPDKMRWLVVQRYLAKGDENDWRLFVPHINPEALHWSRAENDIFKIEKVVPTLKDGLDFWADLGWVGDYFQSEAGVPLLVSFNIVDTVMALVKEKELIKYLYHEQEAMWNEIFMGYFGEKALEEYSKRYIIQGWFEV